MINKENTQSVIIYLPKSLVKILDLLLETMRQETGTKMSRSEFIKYQLDTCVINLLNDIKKGQAKYDKQHNDNGKINWWSSD